jgi:Cu/Ag efflux protein CusF
LAAFKRKIGLSPGLDFDTNGVESSPLVETMFKPTLPVLTLCLIAATAANAQPGGGRRGGRGGGSAPTSPAAPTARQTPANEIDIVGVIKAIGPEPDRITISYDAVDALNWPAGTLPFVVSKPALMQGVTVGEKVRFRLDSQQISDLRPY